jgi:hypothetical protein
MTIFNDLSGRGYYPSLQVFYKSGKKRLIKNVTFYTVYEIGDSERVRVWVKDKNKPYSLRGVDYMYNTYYDYKN